MENGSSPNRHTHEIIHQYMYSYVYACVCVCVCECARMRVCVCVCYYSSMTCSELQADEIQFNVCKWNTTLKKGPEEESCA